MLWSGKFLNLVPQHFYMGIALCRLGSRGDLAVPHRAASLWQTMPVSVMTSLSRRSRWTLPCEAQKHHQERSRRQFGVTVEGQRHLEPHPGTGSQLCRSRSGITGKGPRTQAVTGH